MSAGLSFRVVEERDARKRRFYIGRANSKQGERFGGIVLGESAHAILNNVSPLNRLKSWDVGLPIFGRSIQENSLATVRRVDDRNEKEKEREREREREREMKQEK